MSRKKITIYAKCPYYHAEKHALIKCKEEESDKVPVIQITFRDMEERSRYESEFCKKQWTQCPLAKALNAKFGYEA